MNKLIFTYICSKKSTMNFSLSPIEINKDKLLKHDMLWSFILSNKGIKKFEKDPQKWFRKNRSRMYGRNLFTGDYLYFISELKKEIVDVMSPTPRLQRILKKLGEHKEEIQRRNIVSAILLREVENKNSPIYGKLKEVVQGELWDKHRYFLLASFNDHTFHKATIWYHGIYITVSEYFTHSLWLKMVERELDDISFETTYKRTMDLHKGVMDEFSSDPRVLIKFLSS